MNATAFAFPLNHEVIARREQFAAVAARHATVEVPAAVIARAEEDAALMPARAAWCRTPYGVAGKILSAAREISEVTSQIIVARNRVVIDDAALTKMDRDLNEVEEFVALLRDQLNAAREDRFDAQDKGVVK